MLQIIIKGVQEKAQLCWKYYPVGIMQETEIWAYY